MDSFDFSPFDSSSRFPKRGVLPKTETGALSFLNSNPDFDGRGIIVAILDTGCDPGASGLSITSTNKPKFIDIIDSTGSGDCNTSKQIKLSSIINNNILQSPLTSNKLLLNSEWIKENKNNYFNIGMIRAYDFFPKPLIKRIEKKRTEKFGNKLIKSIQLLQNKIAIKTKKLKNLSKDKDKDSNENRKKLKLEIEDLINLCEILSKETNTQSGPIFDVIVWNNGKQFNCVINTLSMDKYINCIDMNDTSSQDDEKKDIDIDSNISDISKLDVLTNYRNCYKYSTISSETLLNYVCNIYDSGNLVSIVVPGGSHGTHVAGIVGGYYPSDSSLNGVAPGVQFVSIKIGDTRLSTMETNQGLMRSLYHIRQNQCDLVNMSYGEPTTTIKTGCFPLGVEELVYKYGIIFISSAGNDGPCLSTAGAPQSSTDSIIGIGAMFSPQMIESEYGLVTKNNINNNYYYEAYSWSSRGPTMDGAIGIKIMSPGGAIAPIPNYTLSRNQLMNGTSMSSPNACGNVALLLSALKQQNILYTPYGIELSLINSANLEILHKIDAVAKGYGLLQINEAYKYCLKNIELINSPIIHYEININGRNHNNCRGIYIRQPLHSTTSYNVSVIPKFHEDCENIIKIKYSMKCMLKSDSPNWIIPAPFTLIAANGRYFEIKVDPCKLKQMHSFGQYIPVFRGYVFGINNDNISAGPLFRIPITVCNHIKYPLIRQPNLNQSEQKCNNNEYKYSRIDKFTVGAISRVFHHIPSDASAMRINIKCVSTKDNKQLRFCFASLYGNGNEQIKFERWARFSTGDELSTSLQRIEPNSIIETTLCQYALSFGESIIEWSIEFIGPCIICNDNSININQGDQYGLITLRTNNIACCDNINQINPVVKYDTFIQYYQPKYATINTCDKTFERGDCDIKNDEMIYNIILEYEFDQKLAGSKNIIKFSLFNNLLYESLYEGNFWMIFDSNKQLITCGEAFEETSKLPKQKGYICKLQLRSSSLKLLEAAKQTILRIDTILNAKQQISCDIFTSKLGILSASNSQKINACITMGKYENKDLYIKEPSVSSLSFIKDMCPLSCGTQLFGYLKLNKDRKECLKPRFRANGQRGNSSLCIPISLNLINIASKSVESKDSLKKLTVEDNKEDEIKKTLEEKQRDAMIDWIKKKLKGDEQKTAFENYILNAPQMKKYNNYLPILNLQLDVFTSCASSKQMIEICDNILNNVNLNEIAAFFGKKVIDKNDAQYKKNNKKYKEQKSSVIDALKHKLNAIKKQFETSQDDDEKKDKDLIVDFIKISKNDLNEFENVYKQLMEWIDVEKDKKLLNVNIWFNLQKNLIGKVLQIINDKINSNAKDDKPPSKEQIEIKMKVYSKYLPNEFQFLVQQIQLDLYKKFPKQYRPF